MSSIWGDRKGLTKGRSPGQHSSDFPFGMHRGATPRFIDETVLMRLLINTYSSIFIHLVATIFDLGGEEGQGFVSRLESEGAGKG